MTFTAEINQRLQEISPNLSHHRTLVFDQWGRFLHASDIEQADQLAETQIAFLTLFSEKYEIEIYPKIRKKVYNCFFYYYEEEKQEINISIQGIDIKNINSGDWEIHYEDETLNPLVMIGFKKWKFSEITMVG